MSEGPFGRREPAAPAPEPDPDPEPRQPAPPPKPPAGIASNTTWIVGVAVVLLLSYITVNTIRTSGGGSRGVKAGTELPPFAAPEATSPLEGDANVLVKRSDGVPPACDVRGPNVVNSCQLAEEGPVVLAFMASRSQRCVDEIDVVDRVAARFDDVGFAVVAIKGDREDVRRLKREHGWSVPVAHDRDGAVSNAYAIAVCPTITFARRGGVVSHNLLGEATEAEIVRRVREIR